MAWLRLIRWPNLLIVALTQFVAWWCVVRPARYQQPELLLTPAHFALLCLSTVFIAAGGYIINDYFDIRIDAINKPEKVILERDIPRRLAIIVHWVLNILAVLFAASIAIPAGHPEWLMLQLGCTLMLWRYSTTWKRQFVIGNVVVGVMTGFTIIALIIYEPFLHGPLSLKPGAYVGHGIPNPALTLGVFALFAFLLTWMREIVKDMEDYKGDDAEGCVTMPIRWGLLRSTRFVQGLGILSMAILVYACTKLTWPSTGINASAIYISVTLVLPLAIWTFHLPRAATVSHYHRASTRIKWIMVSGVVSLWVLKQINYG